MSILYLEEHTSCSNYRDPVFVVVEIKKGEVLERECMSTSVLVFVRAGSLAVACSGFPEKTIEAGSFFLLPKGSSVRGVANTPSRIMTCIFSNDLKLCSRYALEHLFKEVRPGYEYSFHALPAIPLIEDFLKMLEYCLAQGLGCRHYHLLKRDELFLYLRGCYRREELAHFFYPIIGKDMDFKDFVLANYTRVKDVKNFAERANLSVSTFNRRFKETFHEPAYKWLLAHRSEEILKDILMTKNSFSDIADKYEFSSQAYLVSFCKKNFGKTPSELRKDGIARPSHAGE